MDENLNAEFVRIKESYFSKKNAFYTSKCRYKELCDSLGDDHVQTTLALIFYHDALNCYRQAADVLSDFLVHHLDHIKFE